MKEYRVTRNRPYDSPGCPGYLDTGARGGYYVTAASPAEAVRTVLLRLVGHRPGGPMTEETVARIVAFLPDETFTCQECDGAPARVLPLKSYRRADVLLLPEGWVEYIDLKEK